MTRLLGFLRAGGLAATLCGAVSIGAAPQLRASEPSVSTHSSYRTNGGRGAATTTVFRKSLTPATASHAARPKSETAALQWRARRPSKNTSADSSVRPAQYESESSPVAESGPVLRVANDSVLAPPASQTPVVATPRRLTPANSGAVRNARQRPGGDLLVRQPSDESSASDLPSESLTQPDPAADIFGDQPTPSDVPSDPPIAAPPAEIPPSTETPRDELPPPGRLPMPEESPIPMTPVPMTPGGAPSSSAREREMENVLFGPIGEDGQRLGGELGDCLKTKIEVTNKVVVDIPVDISPPVHDATSTWSYDRPWKDITGKTLFTGRPIALDATAGEATFKTVDGQTKRIKLRDLSRVEQGFFLAMYPLPVECHLIDEPYRGRNWIASTYTWKASAACHKPLYFEDVHLERYGHSWGPFMQPVMSSAHFFGTLPILPYKMGVHTPNECIYTLGYYRPGNCAPYMLDPLPISARGALFEAGALIGGVAIIP